MAQGADASDHPVPNETADGGASTPGGNRPSARHLSIDASHFQRDREAEQLYLAHPAYSRAFRTKTRARRSISGAHWQGGDFTSLDMKIDYHATRPTTASAGWGAARHAEGTSPTLSSPNCGARQRWPSPARRARLRGGGPAVPQGEAFTPSDHLASNRQRRRAGGQVDLRRAQRADSWARSRACR